MPSRMQGLRKLVRALHMTLITDDISRSHSSLHRVLALVVTYSLMQPFSWVRLIKLDQSLYTAKPSKNLGLYTQHGPFRSLLRSWSILLKCRVCHASESYDHSRSPIKHYHTHKYTCKLAITWFSDSNNIVICRLVQFPDLNCIKHLWHYVKHKFKNTQFHLK